tara:strand:- start:1913 stop:2224 length:312 start_codon:yes stop_codon:yes gene_type:complete
MTTLTIISNLNREVKNPFADKISSNPKPVLLNKTPAKEKNYDHYRNADGSFKTPNGQAFYDSGHVDLFNIDHQLKVKSLKSTALKSTFIVSILFISAIIISVL